MKEPGLLFVIGMFSIMAFAGVLPADNQHQIYLLNFELNQTYDTAQISKPSLAGMTPIIAMPLGADLSAHSGLRLNTGHLLWLLTTSGLVLQILGYGDISVILACTYLVLLSYQEGISPGVIIGDNAVYGGNTVNHEVITEFLHQVKELEPEIVSGTSVPDSINQPLQRSKINFGDYTALVSTLRLELKGYTTEDTRLLVVRSLTNALSEQLSMQNPSPEKELGPPPSFYFAIIAPAAIQETWHMLTKLSRHPSFFIALSILIQEAINSFALGYHAKAITTETILLNQNLTDSEPVEPVHSSRFWNRCACSFLPLATTLGITLYYYFRRY